jgi:hypothetical protein
LAAQIDNLLLAIADAIEATPVEADILPAPGFQRLRLTPGADPPDLDNPLRNRLFDLALESSNDAEGYASDEERWTFDGVILLRVYYCDLRAIPGQELQAIFDGRVRSTDFVNLHRALVMANPLAAFDGASQLLHKGTIYLLGETQIRLGLTWEEVP